MIYVVSNGDLVQADKIYNPLKNELEVRAIPFTTTIRIADNHDINVNIPIIDFQFVNIKSILSLYKQNIYDPVDIIAVVLSIGKLEVKTSKAGKGYLFQTITLVDNTRYSIEVGFFGNQIDALHLKQYDIMVIRKMEIKYYKELTGSISSNTMCIANPHYLNLDQYQNASDFQNKLKNPNNTTKVKKVTDY